MERRGKPVTVYMKAAGHVRLKVSEAECPAEKDVITLVWDHGPARFVVSGIERTYRGRFSTDTGSVGELVSIEVQLVQVDGGIESLGAGRFYPVEQGPERLYLHPCGATMSLTEAHIDSSCKACEMPGGHENYVPLYTRGRIEER